MLFEFSEAERNTIRHALETYLSDLREALHLEKQILEGVIEQLSV